MRPVDPDDAFDNGWGNGYEAGHEDGRGLNVEAMVLAFHRRFKFPIEEPATPELRAGLAEWLEDQMVAAMEALDSPDLTVIAKRLAMVLHTVYGVALAVGIDLPRAAQRVHQAGMANPPGAPDLSTTLLGDA